MRDDRRVPVCNAVDRLEDRSVLRVLAAPVLLHRTVDSIALSSRSITSRRRRITAIASLFAAVLLFAARWRLSMRSSEADVCFIHRSNSCSVM
jgi:hypothetical protein